MAQSKKLNLKLGLDTGAFDAGTRKAVSSLLAIVKGAGTVGQAFNKLSQKSAQTNFMGPANQVVAKLKAADKALSTAAKTLTDAQRKTQVNSLASNLQKNIKSLSIRPDAKGLSSDVKQMEQALFDIQMSAASKRIAGLKKEIAERRALLSKAKKEVSQIPVSQRSGEDYDKKMAAVAKAEQAVSKAEQTLEKEVSRTTAKIVSEHTKRANAANKVAEAEKRALARSAQEYQRAAERIKRYVLESLNAVNRLANGIRQGFQGATEIFRTLSLSIAAPLGVFLLDSGRYAQEFETQWQKAVKAVETVGIPNELDILKEKIRDIAKTTPTAATQLASWLEQAGQIGIVGGPAVLRYVNLVNKAAIGTDVATDSIAEDIGKLAAAFGKNLSTEEGMTWAEKFVSVLDFVAKKTSTNMQGILIAAKDAAVAGPLLGIHAKDLAVSVGVLINAGLDAAGAGNTLQRFYIQAANNAADFSTMMKNYSRVIYDENGKVVESISGIYDTAEKVKKAFSEDPTQVLIDVLSAIRDTPKDMNVDMLTQFADVVGLYSVRIGAAAQNVDYMRELQRLVNKEWENAITLQQDYNRMLKTSESQQKTFQNNLKDVGMTFANYLLPYYNKLLLVAIPALQELGKWFEKLSDSQKMLVVGLPILVVALTPLVFIISSLAHGLSLLFVAGISTLTGFVHLVFQVGQGFAVLQKTAGGLFGGLVTGIAKFTGASTQGLGVLGKIALALRFLITPVGLVVAAFVGLITVLKTLTVFGLDISSYFITLANNAQTWGESMMKKYASGLGRAAKFVANVLSGISRMIASFFGGGKKTINVNVGGVDGARAEGGDVKKGKDYLVGEQGPEIITAKQDGFVIPNDQLQQAGASNIRSFADGIRSGVRAVERAVTQVAETVSAQLTGAQGVISSIEEWGSNVMRTYLQGFLLADFDILSDVGGKIRSIFELMEGLGQIEEGSWLTAFLDAKTAISQVIDVFNQTGQVAEDIISGIGANMGELGKDVQELIRRWLKYKKVQEEIKALDVQKKTTLKNYDAEIARIARLNISAEEKADLMREAMLLRDEELRQIEAAKQAKEEDAEALKEELDWQQAFIDAQLETLNIFKQMNDEKDSSSGGGADDSYQSIQFDAPTVGGEVETPITEWITEFNELTSRIGAAQSAWESFKKGFTGGASPAQDLMAQGVPDHIAQQVAPKENQWAFEAGASLKDVWDKVLVVWETAEPILSSISGFSKDVSDSSTTISENFDKVGQSPAIALIQSMLEGVMSMVNVLGPLNSAFESMSAAETAFARLKESLNSIAGIELSGSLTLMQALGGALTWLIGLVLSLGVGALGFLIEQFGNLVVLGISGISTIVTWVSQLFTGIATFATGLMETFSAVWNFLGVLFTGGDLKAAWAGLMSSILSGLQTMVLGVVQLLMANFSFLFSGLTNVFQFVVNSILTGVKAMVVWVTGLLNGEAANGIANFFNGIGDSFNGFIGKLRGWLTSAFNMVSDYISDIIAKVSSFDFGGLLGGRGPSASQSSPRNNAKGGIAIGPHIGSYGRFGEAGHEALLPLERLPDLFWDIAGAQGMGGNSEQLIVQVNNPVVREDADIDKIAESVARKLGKRRSSAQRLGGRG